MKITAPETDVQVPIENVADQDVDTDMDNMRQGKQSLWAELEHAINDYQ